jgi:hypothetical protein
LSKHLTLTKKLEDVGAHVENILFGEHMALALF